MRRLPAHEFTVDVSWLTRADPITKLAIVMAGAASVFCVAGAVMLAAARAML